MFWWPEQSSAAAVMFDPIFTHPSPSGMCSIPRNNPQPEVGGSVGKPKINPCSHSHPPLQLQHRPSLPCIKLLGLLTSNVATFLLLTEHSSSESPAFLGTAVWEHHCLGSQEERDGDGDRAHGQLSPPACRDSTHRAVGLLFQAEVLR